MCYVCCFSSFFLIMKPLHLFPILLTLFHLAVSAQIPEHKVSPPYFQQEVNYKIAVTLDDVQHTIKGDIAFEYINHSPDELPVIWIHLWGNAFKNRQTAFCKQKLRDGDGRFYFADATELGGYKGLDFSADGQRVTWKYDPQNPDIAVIQLPKALAPGQSVRIATPFVLKIPASFSRLGHVETSYQMTQWYPKPAVYDLRGWHAMPYLDMGEFYSEFGSFDVTLTLPENYVVGATGILQTASEIEFLNRKVAESRIRLSQKESLSPDTFPASSPHLKTIRYTAEFVHDFAWFADKRFLVLKDTAHLASGKSVDCWAMFPIEKASNSKYEKSKYWEKAAFYVRRAVEFYSDKVGEYPWPQATAVQSALSAGGGMEYPMITVIGESGSAKELDDVITHEVGHNWFYGILASNERDHPFMDEGFNSYYESRYMKAYYGGYMPYEVPKFILNEKKQGSLLENAYLVLALSHLDTPPDTHSNDFSQLAYGLQVYMKTALCMYWLEQSVGTEKFDQAMHAYYQKWQFRHPYPEDFKRVMEEQHLNPGWFMETMQTQKQFDYALKGIQTAPPQAVNQSQELSSGVLLEIQNKGTLVAPFSVTAIHKGKPVRTQWYESSLKNQQQSIFFSVPDTVHYDAYEIDYPRVTLDVNRKNNFRRSSGIFPGMRPLEYRPIAVFQNSRRNTITAVPWVGWNNVEKTMLGLLIYNPPVPMRAFQYYLVPAYATGAKGMVGWSDFRYKFYPSGLFSKITVNLASKSFYLDYNAEDDYYTRFYRVQPQIHADLKSRCKAYRHGLNFRTLHIGRENDLRDSSGEYTRKVWQRNNIYELRYEGEYVTLPHPYRFSAALETQQYRDAFDRPAQYLRGTAEWRQQFYYQNKKKWTLRLFAGYFIVNTQRHRAIEETALSLNPQGFNDYKFDQAFLARSGADNILGRQVSQTEGGFKAAFGSAFAGTLGNSNNFILALNLKTDLPVRLPLGIPLKPYFDLGYFDDATPTGAGRPLSEQLLWSGGLMLEFFKGGLEVYFPLVNSKVLKDRYCEQAGGTNPSAIFCGGNYFKMISWSLRLNFSDPGGRIEKLAK